MRQGNGSDLLGPNDPRSSTIGVIYVAPNDDRESVLAAILTQEKLGRKQIAIVLPNQNKAFQRPVDFDGLKNMRRKLQANLIVVASQGSGPVEFARQRRFTYFTSLENYTQSLREENEASRAAKRGWFGGRAHKPPADTSAAQDIEDIPTGALAANNESQDRLQPAPDPVDRRADEQHASSHRDGAALGLGLGAGALAADELIHRPAGEVEPKPPLMHHEDAADDDLALAAPSPQGAGSLRGSGDPAQNGVQPPPPVHAPVEGDAEDIIRFAPPTRSRDAENAPLPPVMPEPEEEPVVGPVPPTPLVRRSSGQMAAVGAAGVGAGAAMGMGRGSRAVTPGGGPPPVGTTGGGGTAGGSRRRRSRWQFLLLALVALLVFSLLVCGGIAVAAPGTLGALGTTVSHVFSGGPSTTTVTITPKSVDAHNTYVITGVTGTPDSTKRQVEARALSSSSQPESKTVSATGVVNIPSVRATGTLTFSNGSLSAYGVSAGTVFTDARGVQITNDVLAYIPAGNPNTGFGKVTVPAHAVNGGASGNIGAFDFNNVQCCGSSAVAVSNTTGFSGGQDPQKYTAVQQRDVDGAANPLKGPLTQSTQSSLQGQRHANEQFVARPQCTTNVTSNPSVGTKASSVTVTVTAKCSAEVYDQNGAQTIAANLLKSEAAKSPGPGYVLAGNVVTTVTQATMGNNGMVMLLVKAEGIWVYQFSSAYKMQLAKLIAGKSPNEATALLLGQAGVEKVNGINLSGGGKTLPTDATQITIAVVNVPGIQGSPTPTGSPGSGTPTSTISSPVPRPSPSSVPGK
jgi:hypothetical protein